MDSHFLLRAGLHPCQLQERLGFSDIANYIQDKLHELRSWWNVSEFKWKAEYLRDIYLENSRKIDEDFLRKKTIWPDKESELDRERQYQQESLRAKFNEDFERLKTALYQEGVASGEAVLTEMIAETAASSGERILSNDESCLVVLPSISESILHEGWWQNIKDTVRDKAVAVINRLQRAVQSDDSTIRVKAQKDFDTLEKGKEQYKEKMDAAKKEIKDIAQREGISVEQAEEDNRTILDRVFDWWSNWLDATTQRMDRGLEKIMPISLTRSMGEPETRVYRGSAKAYGESVEAVQQWLTEEIIRLDEGILKWVSDKLRRGVTRILAKARNLISSKSRNERAAAERVVRQYQNLINEYQKKIEEYDEFVKEYAAKHDVSLARAKEENPMEDQNWLEAGLEKLADMADSILPVSRRGGGQPSRLVFGGTAGRGGRKE